MLVFSLQYTDFAPGLIRVSAPGPCRRPPFCPSVTKFPDANVSTLNLLVLPVTVFSSLDKLVVVYVSLL